MLLVYIYIHRTRKQYKSCGAETSAKEKSVIIRESPTLMTRCSFSSSIKAVVPFYFIIFFKIINIKKIIKKEKKESKLKWSNINLGVTNILFALIWSCLWVIYETTSSYVHIKHCIQFYVHPIHTYIIPSLHNFKSLKLLRSLGTLLFFLLL